MSYLNQSFINFFKALLKHNSKEWFDENRNIYKKEVKEPFFNLVAEMINRIQEHEPNVLIRPSDAIMRINRDIRFSKDKTPYKTYMGANISAYGKKDKSYPSFAFQISAEEIIIYGGVYMLETDKLENIRNYIAKKPKSFSTAYSTQSFKDKFGNIQGEQYKRFPKELENVAEKEPFIRNKQFYYSASLEPKFITSNELPELLMEYYEAGKKVNDFLKVASGYTF